MPSHDIAVDTHDESYFASFTDLLVGILFIFIIMLMLFANNMRKQEQVAREVAEQVTAMIEARNIVLNEIKQNLQQVGVKVTVDDQQGILHLPNSILFESGKFELSTEGQRAIVKLAKVLKEYVPCLAHVDNTTLQSACANLNLKSKESLESLLIEGHTDRAGENTGFDNWTLSTNRAIEVFKKLRAAEPVLDSGIFVQHVSKQTHAEHNDPVLGVSGYSSRRPVIDKESAVENRRIDIRFAMRSPTPQDVERINQAITAHHAP